MSRKSNDRAIREALASLQLPRMPDDDKLPSIRILVVADIDLPSASALSEHTLQQKNESYDAPIIDLCIACGSFCRDEDLMPYLRGKQMRREQTRQRNSNADDIWGAMPFFRTREQTAALEGLMTAALSQLESIVCRVIYCPGSSDPLSALLPDRPRRLTPNSRNLHQQWLPLAPGLGCAALVYLDAAEPIVSNATQRRDLGSSNNDSYRFSEDVSEDLEEDIDEMAVWTEQLLQVQQTYVLRLFSLDAWRVSLCVAHILSSLAQFQGLLFHSGAFAQIGTTPSASSSFLAYPGSIDPCNALHRLQSLGHSHAGHRIHASQLQSVVGIGKRRQALAH